MEVLTPGLGDGDVERMREGKRSGMAPRFLLGHWVVLFTESENSLFSKLTKELHLSSCMEDSSEESESGDA